MGACEDLPHNVAVLGGPKTLNSGISAAKRAGRLSSQNCFGPSRGRSHRWGLVSRLGLAPTCVGSHVHDSCTSKMYICWLGPGWTAGLRGLGLAGLLGCLG